MPVTRRPSVSLPALAVLFALTTGCHKKAPATTPTPTAAVPAATTDDAAERARRAAADREAEDRARREAEARASAERAATARATLQTAIYFAYDRSDLEAEARSTLEAKLPVLQGNPSIRIRISGHTDERGSDEYNLALGSRRAAAAKRFLAQRGVDESRIEIASFGTERPACSESAETCWSRNRRDEFEITVGTIAAVER